MPSAAMLELKCEQERRGFERTVREQTMKTKFAILTKLTIAGLLSVAVALWTQWLSGDPAYPKFPPGPVIFIAVAAIVAFGTRWWWTPLIGALIAVLVTSGWFVRLPGGNCSATHSSRFGWQVCGRNLCRHAVANHRASDYGCRGTGGDYPELPANAEDK